MNNSSSPIAILLLVWSAFACAAEGASTSSTDYARLYKATHLVDYFQKMAAVSARVFAARNQGSDAEFSRFLSVVASADLSDIDGCVLGLFARSELTTAEVDELISLFESPLGAKLLDESNRVMRNSVEQGSLAKPTFESFLPEDRRRIAEINATAAFKKYGALMASKEWASGMMQCVLTSKAVQSANFKL